MTVSGAIGGKLAGVPVLWHIREILSMPRPIRWVLQRTLSLCATRIVCVSNAVRDSLLREAPDLAGKAVVVYNAVSWSRQAAVRKSVKDLGEELGLAQNALLVGMVGRLLHWKGQEVLAEAAALVLKDRPDVHFVAVGSYFAGEMHYLERLTALVKSLGIDDRFLFGRLPFKCDGSLQGLGHLRSSFYEAGTIRPGYGGGDDSRTRCDCHKPRRNT